MKILQEKNAVIYGASGSLGSAFAKAFAEAGARLFLTGRDVDAVQKLADEMQGQGHACEVAEVDALDRESVNAHMESVVKNAGTVDISFNAIDLKAVQDVSLVEMSVDDFVRPVTIAMESQFLTATAAARAMIKQRSGVILSLTATPGGIGYPYTGGFAPACAAIECFSKNLAAEIGAWGVRVANIRSGGSPDSKVFQDGFNAQPDEMKKVITKLEGDTMLKKLPLMADIANVAVFLASEMSSKITGVTIDVTCGTTSGLNYRVPPISI